MFWSSQSANAVFAGRNRAEKHLFDLRMLGKMRQPMTDVQTDGLRQFWSRLVFFLGMLWGFIPFISLLKVVFTIGPNDMASNVLAEVLNSLTILPASVVVFWRRKLASWWFLADAALILYAVLRRVPNGWHDRWLAVMVIAVP